MERIVVTLGKRNYPITITSGLSNEPVSFLPLRSSERVILATNKTLTPLCLDKTRGILEQASINIDSVIFPGGEQYKNLAVLDTVFTASLRELHDRNTTLVALGGGVVDGLTGLVAASYQRGVRSTQVPTTSPSQVDSSVGGKTAVNHPLGKNVIGAFYQPASVMVDLDYLKTLSPRELAPGLAGVIRYGIILDGAFSNWLGENLDTLLYLNGPAMVYCTRRCCELKAGVIVTGEHETGLRALLNLGHTFDHVIEAGMGYGNWLHGEAVAMGMIMAARTSERPGQSSSAGTQRIITLLTRAGLPVNRPCEMFVQTYLPHMLRDKKILAGEVRLIPPLAIGRSRVRSGVSHELVLNAIVNCQSV